MIQLRSLGILTILSIGAMSCGENKFVPANPDPYANGNGSNVINPNNINNPYQNPYQNQNPYNNPYSNNPYNNSPYNNPYSNPYNNPYNNPYSNSPYNNPYNSPYNNPYSNPYNNPYNNPYANSPYMNPYSNYPYNNGGYNSPYSNYPYSNYPYSNYPYNSPYANYPYNNGGYNSPYSNYPYSNYPYSNYPYNSPYANYPYNNGGYNSPYSNYPYGNPYMNPANYAPYPYYNSGAGISGGINLGFNFSAGNPYTNPYLLYPNYAALNAQAQLQLQLQTARYYNCAYQAPSHYYYSRTVSSCFAVRRYVHYTPSDCACVKAPCDCAKEIERISRSCAYRIKKNTSSTENTTASTSVSTTKSSADTQIPDLRSASVTNTETNTGTTVNTAAKVETQKPTVEENQPVALKKDEPLSFSILGKDAQTLYERLEIKEGSLKNDDAVRTHDEKLKKSLLKIFGKVKVVGGKNIHCHKSKNANKEVVYECFGYVALDTGNLLDFSSQGDPGQSIAGTRSSYTGEMIQIGGEGLDSDTILVTISKPEAVDFLIKRLPDSGGDVTCTNDGTKGSCTFKLKITTGEAVHAAAN